MKDVLLVASEYTDPCFFVNEVCDKLDNLDWKSGGYGLLVISKRINECSKIIEKANELDIPTILHITITGLGGTVYEPNVPVWSTTLKDIDESGVLLCENVVDTVIRIDPVIPEQFEENYLYAILKWASERGIKRCRFSVVDYYPFVRDRFSKLNLPHPSKFSPGEHVSLYYAKRLLNMCKSFGLSLETCAENLSLSEIKKIGCANKDDWITCGLNMELVAKKQRDNCFCDIQKYDLLAYRKECPHNCLYCYWSKFRDSWRVDSYGY